MEAIRDIAVTNAWAAAQQSDIALYVAGAEMGKTVESMKGLCKRAINIFRKLRKLDLRGLAQEVSAKNLSERWMEGRYAIRPLIYDTKGLIALAGKHAYKHRQTFRGSASDSGTSAPVTGTATWSKDVNCKVNFARTAQRTLSARAGVLTSVDVPAFVTLAALDQPFEALWELVPFSFVVDWFLNVGKTIAAWSPNVGLRPLASWVTVFDTVSQVSSITGSYSIWVPPTGNFTVVKTFEASDGSYSRIVSSKTRTINPQLHPLPRFDVKLDVAKLLDLVIIAKQNFWR